MRSLLSCFSVFLLALNLQGQAPKFSNEFLSIGIGAQAMGRSNSVVATANDLTASYWNPSGLVHVKDKEIGAMHAEYFAGIAKFDYLGGALRIDSSSALGLSMIRFGIDDIPNTIELIEPDGSINYDNVTSFSAVDYAFIISYARKNLFAQGLNIGASAKIVHRTVGDFANAWGFGIDLGAQYSINKWRFGVLARDITTTVNAWSYDLNDRTQEVFAITGNEIPTASTEITLPRIILAVGRDFKLNEKLNLLTEINIDLTTDGKRNVLIQGDPVSVDPHFGFELGYKDLVFLRGGLGNLQRELNDLGSREFMTVQPNLGIGVKIQKVMIDYALTDIGDASAGLYSHVFSLKLMINK